MCGLELTCARCPEPFARVVLIPDVEIANLRPFGRHDAEHLPGAHLPGKAGADRYGKRFDQPPRSFLLDDSAIERFVEIKGGTFARLVCGWEIAHVPTLPLVDCRG
jgi:hypothetical protein